MSQNNDWVESGRVPRVTGQHKEQTMKIVPPQVKAPPELLSDEQLTCAQASAISAMVSGHSAMVFAPPASGGTSTAVTWAFSALKDSRISFFTASRARAAGVRNLLMTGLAAESAADAGSAAGPDSATGSVPQLPQVVTPTAYAFALVRTDSLRNSQGEPSLVTGAEQDSLIEELLSTQEWNWPTSLSGPLHQLAGFRTEVRDVIARAQERGLSGDQLRHLAQRANRPVWSTAASMLDSYTDVLALESRTAVDAGPRLDGGALMARAQQLIATAEHAALPEAIVVDGLQDFTIAGTDLISALISRGVPALIITSADQAVESFRGGLPDAAARLLSAHPDRFETIVLDGAPAQNPRITELVDSLRQRLPLAGAPAASRRPRQSEADCDPAQPGVIGAVTARSEDHEAEQIARIIRALRAQHGTSLDDIAVLCRSSAAADMLSQALIRNGVPVRPEPHAVPLREAPIIDTLSTLIRAALDPSLLTPDTATGLLRGAFTDADDMQLRTIRRLLLESVQDGPQSDQLLVRALTETNLNLLAEVQASQPEHRREWVRGALAPLLRIRSMMDAVRALPEPSILDTLWAAWQASGRARRWQAESIQDETETQRMHAGLLQRRLDAMTALFTAADRYQERQPDADITVFLDHIAQQAVPEDSLTPRGQLRGQLSVTTPAALAGSQVSTVIIAGLQDGAWPNVRIRSSILGAADLALLADDPSLIGTPPETIRALQRQSVLMDEVRLFIAAVSRARDRVLVSAVLTDSQQPSVLHRLTAEFAAGAPTWADAILTGEDPGPYPDARRLIAAIRRDLTNPQLQPAARTARLKALQRLATAGIAGADPESWYHQAPSSEEPLLRPTDRQRLSPSRLDTARECVRAFLLEPLADSGEISDPQRIGTALHALAEQHPTVDATTLLQHLPEHLDPPGPDATWNEHAQWERVLTMVEKLGTYLSEHPNVNAVEQRFQLQLGRVDLTGVIDRIEPEAGGVRVVDFKTGTREKTKNQAMEDLQLAAYQTAIAHDALLTDQRRRDQYQAGDQYQEGEQPLDSECQTGQQAVGASLVYVGTSAKKAVIRHQAPLADHANPQWFTELVETIDQRVRAEQIRLIPNRHCKRCSVKTSCPLYAEGEQLL